MEFTPADTAVLCFSLGAFIFFMLCVVRTRWKANKGHNHARLQEVQEGSPRQKIISLQADSPRNVARTPGGREMIEAVGGGTTEADLVQTVPVALEISAPPTSAQPVVPPLHIPDPVGHEDDESITFALEESASINRPASMNALRYSHVAEDSIVILMEESSYSTLAKDLPPSLEALVEQEQKIRQLILEDCNQVVRKVSLAARRVAVPYGVIGSLGVSYTDASCAEVHEVPHGEVPEGVEVLRKGDVIIAAVTPMGLQNVVTRKQLYEALGPLGGTFRGSEVTLRVIRDEESIAKWKSAADVMMTSELRVGGELPPGVFISEACIVTVKVVMSEVKAADADGEYIIAQSEEAKCAHVVKTLFHEFKDEVTQKVTRLGFHRLYETLASAMGLPNKLTTELNACFAEADLTGDGSLSAFELHPLIRSLILDALSQVIHTPHKLGPIEYIRSP